MIQDPAQRQLSSHQPLDSKLNETNKQAFEVGENASLKSFLICCANVSTLLQISNFLDIQILCEMFIDLWLVKNLKVLHISVDFLLTFQVSRVICVFFNFYFFYHSLPACLSLVSLVKECRKKNKAKNRDKDRNQSKNNNS